MGSTVAHIAPATQKLRFQNNLNVTRTLTVVAIDNLLTDIGRNGSLSGFLQINDIHHHLVFLKTFLDGLLHFTDLQSCTLDSLTIECHLIIKEFRDELF